ncbi:helix-turn-helix domain-containing protein [Pseudactinotalea sp. Z1748]|uniref:helix-turn-helix domain-containing protein n=1 Tax=Pseudactinotalea sp. Z1748 TaxID=3413027 RepID=UPI003C7CC71F
MTNNKRITSVHDLRTTDRIAITHTEVAALLGIDARTVASSIEKGELPGRKLGRKLLIPTHAVLDAFDIPQTAA